VTLLAPGDTFGRYRIVALLGKGGMGSVYDAVDTVLRRNVALKLVSATDEISTARMAREARASAALAHPNVIVVYDSGEIDGVTFIAMERLSGKTLRERLRAKDASLDERTRWLACVARALAAAHRASLVHRDVKPENVMICDDGVVKVLDFGIARRPTNETEDATIPALTTEGMLVGTPRYAAPEQIRGEDLDGRADQFAWGVMAFEVLAGRRPWTGTDLALVLAQMLTTEAPSLRELAPEVPEQVERVVLRALSKDRALRYASMDAIADALEQREQPRSSSAVVPKSYDQATQETRLEAIAPPGRKASRLMFAIASGALIAGFVGVAFFRMRHRPDPASAPLTVSALRCQRATTTGTQAADLSDAVGVGTCARIAIDIGVPWGRTVGEPVDVRATLSQGRVDITVTCRGSAKTASGSNALEAMNAVSEAFALELAAPPLTAEEIAEWGARDAESARRIARIYRANDLNMIANVDREVKEVIERDPSSPWAHVLAANEAPGGSQAIREQAALALAHLERLPRARAEMVEGEMLYYKGADTRDRGFSLLQKAYADAPEDPEIGEVYASFGVGRGAPEAQAVVQRVFAANPTRTAAVLVHALKNTSDRDLARDGKYVDDLVATFPEARGWDVTVHNYVYAERFADARAALGFARAIGTFDSPWSNAANASTAAYVELAALDPSRAIELANAALGDPRASVTSSATRMRVAGYQLLGKLAEADGAYVQELHRELSVDAKFDATMSAILLARQRRLFGGPPLTGDIRALVEDSSDSLPRHLRVWAGVAGALLLDSKAARDAALAMLEAIVASDDDPLRAENLRVRMLPLVRVVHGERAATALWRSTSHAAFWDRAIVAREAGEALEATGDLVAAETAYKLALAPSNIIVQALDNLVARLRLARLYRASNRAAEAETQSAIVDRLWKDADAGARDKLDRL